MGLRTTKAWVEFSKEATQFQVCLRNCKFNPKIPPLKYITVLTWKTLREERISFSLFFRFSILCCSSSLRWIIWPFREKEKHLNMDSQMKPEYNITFHSILTVVFNSFEYYLLFYEWAIGPISVLSLNRHLFKMCKTIYQIIEILYQFSSSSLTNL